MGKFNFIGSISYSSENIQADASRTVNLYPLLNEYSEGKDDFIAQLIRTPGLQLAISTTDSAGTTVRGSYTTTKGQSFRVVDGHLQQLTGSTIPLTVTSIGTLLTTSGNVSFADNGVLMVIVDGTNGYAVNLNTGTATGFAQIIDANFYGGNIVLQYDGYFVFNKPDTDRKSTRLNSSH